MFLAFSATGLPIASRPQYAVRRSGGAADCSAEAEQLRVGHDHSSGALAQRRQRRRQRKPRAGTDTDFGLAAEVRDRQPATIELAETQLDIQAERVAGEPGVDADEAWLTIHASIVATERDRLWVASSSRGISSR